jgi:hypothetical protein
MKSKNSLPIGHIGIIEAHSWGLLIPQLCVTTVSYVFYVVKKKSRNNSTSIQPFYSFVFRKRFYYPQLAAILHDPLK